MQESIHIQLLDKTLQAVQANDENKAEHIGNELHQHEKAIDNLILSYYFMERKRVYNILIDTCSIQIDRSGKGNFRVNYMLGTFNACADMDTNEQSYMMIMMQVDFDKRSMVLTGEDIPEREPDGL